MGTRRLFLKQNKIVAAQKAEVVCPDGNENPDGAFINKTNAGFCTKGRGRAITFFKINS